MSYLEDAAAELVKVRAANAEMRFRGRELRRDGADDDAEELEAIVAETSFRLAEDYIALAALERDAGRPAVTPEPGQE